MKRRVQRVERGLLLPAATALMVLLLVALRPSSLSDALSWNLAALALLRGLAPEQESFFNATVYRITPEYQPSTEAAVDLRRSVFLLERGADMQAQPLLEGVTRLALAEGAEALSVLRQASGDRFSMFWSAIAAEQVGDQEQANEIWRDLKAAPLLVARARRQLAAGQMDEAERSAMLAVEICAQGGCSAPAEGWAVRGAIYRQTGRTDEAEAAYRHAVALASLPEYREGLALSALEAGDYETAREVLRSLTTDYPHIAAYHEWLARADAALGDRGAP